MVDIISQYCSNTQSQILIVGCGHSRLAEEMYEYGFQNLTCIDFSYSAIQLNQEEYKDNKYHNMTFVQMDVRNLQFKD